MGEEIETMHRPFEKWLRDNKIPFIRARSDRASTIARGIHDFTVLLPKNLCICLEFKTKHNDLDKFQVEWRDQCAAAGVTVHVIRSVEAAVELVRLWRDSIPAQECATSSKNPATGRAGPILHVLWGKLVVQKDGRGGWEKVRDATEEDRLRLPPVRE